MKLIMKFKFIHLPDSFIQKTFSVEKVKCLNQESNGYSAWNVPSGVETVTFGLPEHETNNSKVIGINLQVAMDKNLSVKSTTKCQFFLFCEN